MATGTIESGLEAAARATAPPGPPPAETVPARVAVARGRGVAAVAGAGVAGFLAIFGLVKAKRSEAVDLALMLKLQRRNHPVVAALMRWASWFGFPPQSRLIPPAILVGLWLARLRVEALFLLAAWGAAFISTVTKAYMRRPRPVAGQDLRVAAAPLGGSSFPSGHVITYVGFYGFLAFLAHTLLRPVGVRRAIVAFLAGLLALVGPSRIHQGHHWPTDVTASYLLGTSYLTVLINLYRRVKARHAGTRA